MYSQHVSTLQLFVSYLEMVCRASQINPLYRAMTYELEVIIQYNPQLFYYIQDKILHKIPIMPTRKFIETRTMSLSSISSWLYHLVVLELPR